MGASWARKGPMYPLNSTIPIGGQPFSALPMFEKLMRFLDLDPAKMWWHIWLYLGGNYLKIDWSCRVLAKIFWTRSDDPACHNSTDSTAQNASPRQHNVPQSSPACDERWNLHDGPWVQVGMIETWHRNKITISPWRKDHGEVCRSEPKKLSVVYHQLFGFDFR